MIARKLATRAGFLFDVLSEEGSGQSNPAGALYGDMLVLDPSVPLRRNRFVARFKLVSASSAILIVSGATAVNKRVAMASSNGFAGKDIQWRSCGASRLLELSSVLTRIDPPVLI
jgi:hypothetical protein